VCVERLKPRYHCISAMRERDSIRFSERPELLSWVEVFVQMRSHRKLIYEPIELSRVSDPQSDTWTCRESWQPHAKYYHHSRGKVSVVHVKCLTKYLHLVTVRWDVLAITHRARVRVRLGPQRRTAPVCLSQKSVGSVQYSTDSAYSRTRGQQSSLSSSKTLNRCKKSAQKSFDEIFVLSMFVVSLSDVAGVCRLCR
jgi:hypothetical protein